MIPGDKENFLCQFAATGTNWVYFFVEMLRVLQTFNRVQITYMALIT